MHSGAVAPWIRCFHGTECSREQGATRLDPILREMNSLGSPPRTLPDVYGTSTGPLVPQEVSTRYHTPPTLFQIPSRRLPGHHCFPRTPPDPHQTPYQTSPLCSRTLPDPLRDNYCSSKIAPDLVLSRSFSSSSSFSCPLLLLVLPVVVVLLLLPHQARFPIPCRPPPPPSRPHTFGMFR